MGKSIEHPRYNVVCTRLTDEEFDAMHRINKYDTNASFVLEAIQEKIEREEKNGKRGTCFTPC